MVRTRLSHYKYRINKRTGRKERIGHTYHKFKYNKSTGEKYYYGESRKVHGMWRYAC